MQNIEQLSKILLLNAENGPNISYLAPASPVTTAAAVTYTPANLMGGWIHRDCNGSGRTDVLPTAALLVAYLRERANVFSAELKRHMEITFTIQNESDAAETITIQCGTGGSPDHNGAGTHTLTIPQNTSKKFSIKISSSVIGSEAYVLRNLGGYTT